MKRAAGETAQIIRRAKALLAESALPKEPARRAEKAQPRLLPLPLRNKIAELRRAAQRARPAVGALDDAETVDDVEALIRRPCATPRSPGEYARLVDAFMQAPTAEERFFEHAERLVREQLGGPGQSARAPPAAGQVPRLGRRVPRLDRARAEFERRRFGGGILRSAAPPELPRQWRPSRRVPDATVERIRVLFRDVGPPRWTPETLSREFGVSREAIVRILRRSRRALGDGGSRGALELVEELDGALTLT